MSQNFPMLTMGQRLKALRKSRRLTQVQVSELVGMSQNGWSDLERDKRSDMSGQTLEAICRLLVTTPRYVLHGTDGVVDHESLLQEAELSAIFRELPPSAQSALLNSARLLREAMPATSPAQPIIGAVKPGTVNQK